MEQEKAPAGDNVPDSVSGKLALPYVPDTFPTAEEFAVADARKLVLRALDTKVSQQETSSALQAVRLALKLVGNIVDHPTEPKYQQFKSSNQAISVKLLRVPGMTELLVAAGFRTKVVEFQEHWVADVSEQGLRVLKTTHDGLSQYEQLLSARLVSAQKQRQEQLAGANASRLQTLAEIEADKAERKDRSW
eukprot:CAMPEP_0119313780 /NCGR_PEP_ID=MMETSP1333-20130426/30374_1 /TAXON_ID=418940 /ORGANISM="Scyphosphaera apsteinii, Strain RCC1455" /LENGTH=190 /DNA_ID=CAMNT_0007318715 /DNA_START=29 /DNA_END=598 /DNA_ORIENTATION=+